MFRAPKSAAKSASKPRRCAGDQNFDPVQVFCRIRPTTYETCMKVISSSLISVTIPENVRGYGKEMIFAFQRIFQADSTQQNVFEVIAQPLVENLFHGKNGLLFAYGVTGSGKTFTMSGDQQIAGIMPRCISMIFKMIEGQQADRFIFKPDKLNGFEIQNDRDAHADKMEADKKQRFGGLERFPSIESSLASVSSYEIPDCNPPADNYIYSVFITYIEIYNNAVYDLLEETGNKPVQSKIIREDAQHQMFVHGVTEVEVKSPAEAMHLFYIGKKRKRMGRTELNHDSSRSHSVFTIRLVQALNLSSNISRSKIPVVVSQLSLVDLAGSERSSRTKNTGLRLKEASNINNSLLNLRLCLDVLRENQENNTNRIVPYRDSKITHLFKSFFENKGQIHMVVCVNPNIQDFEETIQVMKFAETTQTIQLARDNQIPATPRRINDHNKEERKNPKIDPQYLELNEKLYSFEHFPFNFAIDPENETDSSINNCISFLKNRVQQYKEAYDDFKETEERWRTRFLYVVARNSTRAIREGETNIKSMQQRINDLEKQRNEYKDILTAKNEEIANYKMELKRKEMLVQERDKDLRRLDGKLTRTARLEQEFEKKLREQGAAFKHQIQEKENKLRLVKKITSDETPIAASYKRVKTHQHPRTVTSTSVENLPIPTINTIPPTPVKSHETPTPHRPPHITRRRSKSECWLEHVVGMPTKMDTVLQPNIKRTKTLTKLIDSKDLTKSVTNYCLMSQERDTDGEIETRLIKGDVVPTTTGGAQVIFNDVEKLTVESPLKGRKRSNEPLRTEELIERCSVGVEGHKRFKP